MYQKILKHLSMNHVLAYTSLKGRRILFGIILLLSEANVAYIIQAILLCQAPSPLRNGLDTHTQCEKLYSLLKCRDT